MKKLYIVISVIVLFSNIIAADFPWFSQGDERWKQEQLGNSRRSTIGRSGCVLSCLSMLLNAEASNPRITPDGLNDWLRQNGGYSGNLMKWQIPGEIDGNGYGLELVAQITKKNDWNFLSEQLALGNKVIVKVSGKRSHWVLVTKQDGPSDKASSYPINDPGTKSYVARTLAYYGGFKAARSYSGNWLDEETFSLDTDIQIVPVSKEEFFFYDLVKAPHPADVYVKIENKLHVPITGYFILGLFDKDGNFLRNIDYEYATVSSNQSFDLLYEMDDITDIQNEKAYVNIIYSKYFSNMPSSHDTLALVKNKITKPVVDDGSQDLEDIEAEEDTN